MVIRKDIFTMKYLTPAFFVIYKTEPFKEGFTDPHHCSLRVFVSSGQWGGLYHVVHA